MINYFTWGGNNFVRFIYQERKKTQSIFFSPIQRQTLWARPWWGRVWAAAPVMMIRSTSSSTRGARSRRQPTATAGWHEWLGFVKWVQNKKRCMIWFTSGVKPCVRLAWLESWLMIGEGAIIDELLDGECVCNKAPVWLGADCVVDGCIAESVGFCVRRIDDCRG